MSKDFKPQDYFRYRKLRMKWRKPKGLQSKMREDRKGAGARVKIGYGTPAAMRGLERGVVKARIIRSLKDLEDVQGEAIILSAGLGKKKIMQISAEAGKRNIRILNKGSVDAAKKRDEKIRQAAELRNRAKGGKEKKPTVEPAKEEKLRTEEKKTQ